jgi:hypothetical protein
MGEIGEGIALLWAPMEHVLRPSGLDQDGLAVIGRGTGFGKAPLECGQGRMHAVRLFV